MFERSPLRRLPLDDHRRSESADGPDVIFDLVLGWFAKACFGDLRGFPMSSGHRNGLRGRGGRPRATGVGLSHSLVVTAQPVPMSSLRDGIVI
jgi:hypothetical protein